MRNLVSTPSFEKKLGLFSFSANVYSSSGGKFYTVTWDGDKKIMCNDNSSYYKGYIGYPAVAYLMYKGVISYDKKLADALAGIAWKDLNVKNKKI